MITVRPISASDHEAWSALYAGYADFYQVVQTPDMRDTVWSWLMDGAHEVNGFIAVGDAGDALGLAHYRPFSRPLSASVGGFLDDLFVTPPARGHDVSKLLIAAVVEVAKERNWSVVRWLTAENNYRARSSYDKVATRTNWTVYDIRLAG
jgi:GNAT superfamily N-acetyltransferase